MAKIKSFAELKKIKEDVQSKVALREQGENIENLVSVRVAMATCGIASGAREVMNFIVDECASQGVTNVAVTQTGCMGYCYAEPTIEVTLPGQDGVVFGNVDENKAKEIIETYIKEGTMVDGIIPQTHKTIE